MHTNTYTHTCACTDTHMHWCMHTHTHKHAHAHTRTHTHTPAYKHFASYLLLVFITALQKLKDPERNMDQVNSSTTPHCGKNSLSALVVTPKQLVSNWIWMSCQPHRVTSGQSNSIISKCTVQNSSHKYTLSEVNPQDQSLHKQKTKHTYTNITHKFSKS